MHTKPQGQWIATSCHADDLWETEKDWNITVWREIKSSTSWDPSPSSSRWLEPSLSTSGGKEKNTKSSQNVANEPNCMRVNKSCLHQPCPNLYMHPRLEPHNSSTLATSLLSAPLLERPLLGPLCHYVESLQVEADTTQYECFLDNLCLASLQYAHRTSNGDGSRRNSWQAV